MYARTTTSTPISEDDELDLTIGDNQGAEACIQNEDTFNTT